MTAIRVYLDANVFIAAYEMRTARSDYAWWFLEAIEAKEFGAVTSELTLAEILVKPLQMGDDDLARQYHNIISSEGEFEVLPVERKVLVEAATLRGATRSVKLPDAIHLATARLSSCRYIVSDDRRIPVAPDLTLVSLGPHALDIVRGETA